jgi:hypothetical protein
MIAKSAELSIDDVCWNKHSNNNILVKLQYLISLIEQYISDILSRRTREVVPSRALMAAECANACAINAAPESPVTFGKLRVRSCFPRQSEYKQRTANCDVKATWQA